jgi:hypothetical protein
LDVEIAERDPGRGSNALEPPADNGGSVLGGIEENAAGVGHHEAAQAGDAGGHSNGEVKGQEVFAALGLAADDADGVMGPQIGDEPAQLRRLLGKPPGRRDRDGRARGRVVPRASAKDTFKNN